MPLSLIQHAASGNQILASLPREKVFSNLFSKHVIFLNVLSLIDRCSEFFFGIRREHSRTNH